MLKIHIDFEWKLIFFDKSIPYNFPDRISKFMKQNYKIPAVYRWIVEENGKIKSMYIGEAEELCPRRVYSFLNPGPSQSTNFRLKIMFNNEISNGKKVLLEKLHFSEFMFDDKIIKYNELKKKQIRIFLESLLIVHYTNKKFKILNSDGK